MFTLIVIPTERSEWRNLFRDVSTALDRQVEHDRHDRCTTLDMTGVN